MIEKIKIKMQKVHNDCFPRKIQQERKINR